MLYRPRKEGFGVFLCNLYAMTGSDDCKTGKIEEADIHGIVLALLQQQAALAEQVNFRRKENLKSALLTAADLHGEIQQLRKLCEKAKTTKLSIWERYRSGEITKEALQNESEKITKQAEMYSEKIAGLEDKRKTLELSSGEENIFVLFLLKIYSEHPKECYYYATAA
jgi:hypothetical protein